MDHVRDRHTLAGAAVGLLGGMIGLGGAAFRLPLCAASWGRRGRAADLTIVLLYGIDIKVAGRLFVPISLPTMRIAFARYSRDQAFKVLRGNGRFCLP